MAWERHYTGIETLEKKNLYVQRNTITKKVKFIRVHLPRNRYFGIFLGRTNYVKPAYGGLFEIFSNRYHFGVSSWSKAKVLWSGSGSDPYHTFILRLGWFGLGRTSPKFLKSWKESKIREYWESCPGPE